LSDALIREVQEDLQRERALALARRYGGYVIGLALAAVVATAGYVGWTNWQQGVRAEESAKLLSAVGTLDKGEAGQALPELLAVAQESSDGVAEIARLQAAQAASRDGKTDEAVNILETAVQEGPGDAILKEAAQIAAIGRRLDSGDPAALAAELEPLTGGDRAFRHQAREFLALVKVRGGDREAAKTILDNAIDDASIPAGARARLTELRAALEAIA
jgi:hypothetical protein